MRAPAVATVVLVALVLCVASCSDDEPSAEVADSEQQEATAESGTDEPLVAAFSYEVTYQDTGTVTTYCPLESIAFTDESEGEPTEWEWEFDGGEATSTEQNPVVEGEVYEATLTVTRGDETDSVTEGISFAVC